MAWWIFIRHFRSCGVALVEWRGLCVVPTPPIMFSTSTATTTTTSDLVNDDGTKSVAVAAKTRGLPSCPEEEEEEEGNDDENENQGDDEEESEEEGNDENEDEYNEEDEFLASHDLHAILNHKNAHSRSHSHPSNNTSVQQQPSYDELVLEIRALTSAIHSHRDSQERIARNAYNSNVGKGMTDDAMDFLRKKKEGLLGASLGGKKEGLLGASLVHLLLRMSCGRSRRCVQKRNLGLSL